MLDEGGEVFGIIFGLEADENFDILRIFALQTFEGGEIIADLIWEHPEIGIIAVGKDLRAVVGEAERFQSAFDGGFDIFALIAEGVAAACGMGMIICDHYKISSVRVQLKF